MKRAVFCVVLLLLLGMAVPTWAQDNKSCDADSIKNQMNELVAGYLSAQAKATDAKSALAAANDLQTQIAALTAACANGNPEATAEAVGNGMPAEGKWMLTWQEKTVSCAAENYNSPLESRPVFLQVSEDGKGLLLNDLFWFGKAEFRIDKDGNYAYLRNEINSQGNPFSYTYVLSQSKSDIFTGTSTDYFPGSACESLRSHFTFTLVDASVVCMVGSESSANLRSGPGTTFDRFGKLESNKAVDAVGYATSKDGFKWWKLGTGGWIRADLVKEAGRCDKVPETKP